MFRGKSGVVSNKPKDAPAAPTKASSSSSSASGGGGDLAKRVDDLEKELKALKEWKKEVTDYLNTLGFSKKAHATDATDGGGGDGTLAKQTSDRRHATPPLWFCSYCWVNSKSAFQLKEVNQYSGEMDPRDVWQDFHNKYQLNGWLDKEYLGSAGLFDDIVEGLLEAKVMVAFISDEYANSENCLAELTFARKSIRIPVIPVIVGTGWNWQKTKVGLLLSDALYIDMTDVKDSTKKDEKITELKKRLLELLGNEKVYLEQSGQVKSIDDIKVGDAVEKMANDPLNFSSQFQKTPIKELTAGDHLLAWYWWPCEVIEVNVDTGAYKLHYWG